MLRINTWHKSTRSGASGHCVEALAAADGTVRVRDTKQNGTGPELAFTPQEWDAFVGGVKDGEFDRP